VEDVKVTIKDAFVSGFCFGMGLGLALIVYGLLALAAIRVFVLPAGRISRRQVITYRPTYRQQDSQPDPRAAGRGMYDVPAPSKSVEDWLEQMERDTKEMETRLIRRLDANRVDITAECNK